MFFHDFLDDGEAEAGALLAGRNVGFGQTVLLVGRQAEAVVLDPNHGPGPLIDVFPQQYQGNPAVRLLLAFGRPPAFDGFGRVLEDVGQGPSDLTAVAQQFKPAVGNVGLEGNLGIAVAFKEHRLAADFGDILRPHGRLRHAREGREVVDHAPYVLDLTDDGLGTHGKGFGIALDLVEVFPPQPLGRELDWRQRILDLMGDAPGDIGPGRLALRRKQFGDVVEGDHEADHFLAQPFGPPPARAASARDRRAESGSPTGAAGATAAALPPADRRSRGTHR